MQLTPNGLQLFQAVLTQMDIPQTLYGLVELKEDMITFVNANLGYFEVSENLQYFISGTWAQTMNGWTETCTEIDKYAKKN